MAIVFLKDSTLTNIANAIRGKLGTTETMLPSEMPGLIETITGGGGEQLPVREGQIVLGFNPGAGIDTDGRFWVKALNDERAIYALDSEVFIKQDASVLGMAPDFCIVDGCTASSSEGIAMQGKLVAEYVKTQAGGSIGLIWGIDADGYARATLAESISVPAYTMQIMTTNPGDGSDSIVYYAPGSTEKTNITLTGEYQSITCGDFIALHRGSSNNVTTNIYLRDNADTNVMTIGVTDKYAVGLNPHGGWSVINIGAIVKDLPSIKKIRIGYSAG